MDWIINKKKPKKSDLAQRSDINTKVFDTLRYCLKCEHVWEIGTSGSILFYKHLPTYGLPRKDCKSCNKLSILSYKRQKGEKK